MWVSSMNNLNEIYDACTFLLKLSNKLSYNTIEQPHIT